MTESYTMSPSTTVSSSGATPGCMSSSPAHRRTSCRGSPSRGDVQDDDDEISVGCPSPLPLVMVATAAGNTEDELMASSREDYAERLSPRRSYPRDALTEDEESYSRNGDYRMSNGRTARTRESGDSVTTLRDEDEDDDDEEEDEDVDSRTGSNGTAAAAATTDDYFKPLKRLKMVQMQHSDEEDERERESNDRGVKSFSILDILSHRPKAKIVRPWDTVDSGLAHQHRHHLHHHHHHHHQQQHHPHHLHHHHHSAGPRDLSLMGMSLASMSSSISEPPLSSSSSSGRSSVSDSGSPDPLAHHHHHHATLHHGIHPGLHHPALQQPQQSQQQFKRKSSQQQQQQQQQQQHGSHAGQNGKRTTGQGSPLDALFQMTSKTFDAGEHSQGKRYGFFSLGFPRGVSLAKEESQARTDASFSISRRYPLRGEVVVYITVQGGSAAM
ncbi:hypothetical protein EAI_01026 [Harpegnathos saltator]|uniref:Uncharacterized protein n=1 Tax=Harpegnathos saltator TaxID=610380 RepID=E2B3M4_HARSA|nr:hypothetical protein EAI_01026 [Harpegnathos saltator]